jgi:hypothetical protein
LCLHALNSILRAVAQWCKRFLEQPAQHQVRAAIYVPRTHLFACLTLQAASVCAPWMCSSRRARPSGAARQPALLQNRCCRKLVQMASMCKIHAPQHCGQRQRDAGGNGHAAAAILLRARSRALQALAATMPNAALLCFLFSFSFHFIFY